MLNMFLTLIYIFQNISLNNWQIFVPIFLAYSWEQALSSGIGHDVPGYLNGALKGLILGLTCILL